MPTAGDNRCPITVKWADLSWVELRCVRREGHTGAHSDGVFFYDHHGLRVPRGRDMEQAS